MIPGDNKCLHACIGTCKSQCIYPTLNRHIKYTHPHYLFKIINFNYIVTIMSF